MRYLTLMLLFSFICSPSCLAENEVMGASSAKVQTKMHPRTGEPLVTIIAMDGAERHELFEEPEVHYGRPNYQLLSPDVHPKDIQYEGPYNSRKKVYALAAALATVGTVSSIAAASAIPAATATTGAGGGAGLGAAGLAIGSAATAGAIVATQKEIPDDYSRVSESSLLETKTDFYRYHILKIRDE